MKHIAALAIVSTLSSAGCVVMTPKASYGRAAWHWNNVISLPPGTLIRVSTADDAHEGALIDADAAGVTVQTKHGAIASPIALVRRVERIEAPKKSRTRRALTSAAAGTAAFAASVAFTCLALSGRPCATTPKSLAISAALFGTSGAVFDDRRAMTIYVRP